jgi:hypothetical protein
LVDNVTVEPTLDARVAAVNAEAREVAQTIRALQAEAGTLERYPLERAIGGIGRWLVPRDNTLEGNLALVLDEANDIDFSPTNYPLFDGIITEKYEHPAFFDALHDDFPRFQNLHDNIATVRNFLLQQYFPDDSVPFETEVKRGKHMQEIAEFIADGLNHDRTYLGLVRVHNPFANYIDVAAASQPDGEGARYLYQKILEMQRHNNWTRPFVKLTELLGGAAPYEDWELPSFEDSAFAYDAGADETQVDAVDVEARIGALAAIYERLEVKRGALETLRTARNHARDLDNLANQLLLTYFDIRQSVSDLAQPVRREAVDIAHDILNKLKLKIGDIEAGNSLGFSSDDANNNVGAVSAAGRLLQRMAGMARAAGVDALAIPSVNAAHHALGQIAYMAKAEAYRLASAVGDTRLAGTLKTQLDDISALGGGVRGRRLRQFFDQLSQGIHDLSEHLHGMGLGGQAPALQTNMVGRGQISRQQTLQNAKQQQTRHDREEHKAQDHGAQTQQQMGSMRDANQATQVMAQLQQAQKAQQTATGQAPQGFQAPLPTVRRGASAQATMKNLKAVQAQVRAEINKALITPVPPPKSVSSINPALVAGFGNSLNMAQASAATLPGNAVGPKNAGDIIRAQAAKRTQIQSANDAAIDDHQKHLQHQMHIPPNSGGNGGGGGRGR